MGVRSLELGLIGKCDLVECYLEPGGRVVEAVPVEFKRAGTKRMTAIEYNCVRRPYVWKRCSVYVSHTATSIISERIEGRTPRCRFSSVKLHNHYFTCA
jgi:hypothetical protein